jgi:hypothetical protein
MPTHQTRATPAAHAPNQNLSREVLTQLKNGLTLEQPLQLLTRNFNHAWPCTKHQIYVDQKRILPFVGLLGSPLETDRRLLRTARFI